MVSARVLACAVALLLSLNATADAYPDRPVTIVVGFGIGGSADRMTRTMAPFLGAALGQPVVVVNKGGAGTLLAASYVLEQPPDGYTVFATGYSPYLSNTILEGNADYSIDDCPNDEIDILMIPGGYPRAMEDFDKDHPRLVKWVRERHGQVEMLASVCYGALVLAHAGLLDGLQVTSHHGALPALRRLAPKARIVPGARYVDNGEAGVLCAAGVSAGFDLALHMVRRLLGADDPAAGIVAADKASQIMEYNATTNFVVG